MTFDFGSATNRTEVYEHKQSGNELVLSSLWVRDYVFLQRQSLREYKREMIATWKENRDQVPDDRYDVWLKDAMERAEKLTLADLPVRKIKNNDGQLNIVPYWLWWIGGSLEGMRYMVWRSALRHKPDISLDEIDSYFCESLPDLSAAADVVEDLSEPKLGNSQAPPQEEASLPVGT